MRALLVVLLLVAHAPRTDACTCRSPKVDISPSGTDVPINSTVMLWIPERVGTKLSFVVRKQRGASIATTAKSLTSAKTEIVELTPKQPLAASTTYEVLIKDDGKVVQTQTFTTGTGKQTIAPAWKAQGIGIVRYIKPYMCGPGTCMNCTPQLEVYWSADDPKPERLRVGVWIGATIDLTKPPTTFVAGVSRRVLGHRSWCGSADLVIPNDPKLKFAAKLFDTAGNASDVREFVVNTMKPEPEYEP